MSTLRISLAFAVLLAVGTPLRFAQGQIVSELENGKHSFLFIEPDTFRPDFQFFAQADATDYEVGRDRDPPCGFFFTYDRLWINVTRPETQVPIYPPSTAPGLGNPFALNRFSFVAENPSPFEGDFTWGNRLEMGFVDGCDRGWTMVGWHIDGPNEENIITNGDRLAGPFTNNGAFVDENIDPITESPYIQQNIGGPSFPPDTVPTAFTDLPISNSINTAKMSSFEIMRIMERQTFHNGMVWEPMVGVRYIKFSDRYHYSFYQRSETDGPGFAVDDNEFYRDQRTFFQNDMLGGQLGFRLFKQTGHWNLSTEFRMFALQNWQAYSSTVDNYIWSSGAAAPEDIDEPTKANPLRTPPYARQERIVQYQNGDEFVWGGELKMEAAYQLTRDISFRTGIVFLDLGQGVGRGLTFATNNQDVQMGGVTFGLTINK